MAELNGATAEIIRTQSEEATAADKLHQETMTALRERMAEGQAKLLDKIMGGKATYPQAVMDIANALTAQPILIPAVDAFLKKVKTKVEAAIQAALQAALTEA